MQILAVVLPAYKEDADRAVYVRMGIEHFLCFKKDIKEMNIHTAVILLKGQ